jgi:hypothetical protein
MQLVPIAPAPTQPHFQAIHPHFTGPLMERIVYELHHSPSASNDPNQNTPQLNGKVNQLISDLHHHSERHTLPYWPNSRINPARIAPFWPDEQNQLVLNGTPTVAATPTPSFYLDYIGAPYYSAGSIQQKLVNSDMKMGARLQFIA